MASAEQVPRRVLIVEDEAHLAAGLKLNLELDGYEVEVAGSVREAARKLAGATRFDLVVLDRMLPDADGAELCRRMRQAGQLLPVLMLTARATPGDRVEGLEAGADDYLPKPFELDELRARVRALLRRRRWDRRDEAPVQRELLRFGQAEVDFAAHEVRVGGEPRRLTTLELDLLRYLAEHAGRVVSREELLERVWKVRAHGSRRTVDNFIVRLRRHFEPDPSNPRYFLSVRGAGYKFDPSGGHPAG